jgi:hypothetical protein
MTQDDQSKRYSRSDRIKGLPQPGEDTAETTTDAPRVVEHAKKGFTALQKVIALISTHGLYYRVVPPPLRWRGTLGQPKAGGLFF